MSEIMGLEVRRGVVYQEIDLRDLFGVDVSRYSSLKKKFGQACIDAIVTRCNKGLDFRGGRLPAYSDSYAESDVFKAYGKSKNNPNETLRGDMLATMDVLSNQGNKIQIGWNDEENAEKARGHITGYAGHPTIKGAPKREFFGLTTAQLEGLMIRFEDEIKQIKNEDQEDKRKEKKSEAQQVLEYVKELESKNEQAQLGKLLGIGFDNGE